MNFKKISVKFFVVFISLISNKLASDVCDHIQVADSIIAEHVDYAAKELNLQCYGTGGSMPNKIKSISIFFQTEEDLNVDEMRLLVVHLTESLVVAIKQKEACAQYFEYFPLQHSNIDISIKINRKNFDSSRKIDSCWNIRDNLYFSKKDDSDPSKGIQTVLSETYKDALEKVKEQNPNFDLSIKKTGNYKNK